MKLVKHLSADTRTKLIISFVRIQNKNKKTEFHCVSNSRLANNVFYDERK
jgi:hypothetical protein